MSGVLTSSEYGHMLFDRGKEFVVDEMLSYYSTAIRGFKFGFEMLAFLLFG